MDETNEMAERFEAQRPRLRSVAYRMLGSFAEADDAVQEAWIRLGRSDADEIANFGGWLTTVVARVCLNMLRSRRSRGEESLEIHLPDLTVVPLGSPAPAAPEEEAVLADSVGLALLVVLDTLDPAERLAFVLHDMFAMPFDEIASLVGRTPIAARQLASRARRRVRGAAPDGRDNDTRARKLVQAFLAASRNGDFDGLVAILDPNVTLRVDYGPRTAGKLERGAQTVAGNALMFREFAPYTRMVRVNGEFGAAAVVDGRLQAVVAFTVRDGRIVELNILSDPERLEPMNAAFADVSG